VFEHLLKIRFVAIAVVVMAILHSVAFLWMGAQIAFATYWQILRGDSGNTGRPGLELLHALDFLLVSLVLLILALGVAKLFLVRPAPTSDAHSPVPVSLQVETFTDLKVLLWETILTALLIEALSVFTSGLFGKLDWSVLIVPAGIALLSLSLYFIKRG
jgi:uncharacterized membrane protein YqhA